MASDIHRADLHDLPRVQHTAEPPRHVVPITYSEHLGQMHTALRDYKGSPPRAQRYAMIRLAAMGGLVGHPDLAFELLRADPAARR